MAAALKVIDQESEFVGRIVSYGSVMADAMIKHQKTSDLPSFRLIRSPEHVANLANLCFWATMAQE